MAKTFSQRMNLRPAVNVLQLNDLNLSTRIDLYNAYYKFIHQDVLDNKDDDFGHEDPYIEFYRYIWADFLKRKLDVFPDNQNEVRDAIREVIMDGDWYRVFDIFEYFLAS
jgi:hypothetical protein